MVTLEFNPITHARMSWFHPKYVEYVKELSGLIAHYGNPWDEPTPWYIADDCTAYIANDSNSCVGFFMIGWGEKVDDDVDSEILELTVFSEYRNKGYGRLLAKAAYHRLWGRCGWQVYKDNTRGLNFWNAFCESHGIQVCRYDRWEQSIPVVQFRVQPR